MCEIFGISASFPCVINDYLKTFYSHSSLHPHGWRLAYRAEENSSALKIYKGKEPAFKSKYLEEKLSEPVVTDLALAHIRYATIGNVEFKNCHPHKKADRLGHQWTLIHNGTIFDFKPLDKFISYQSGDTDSERILLYIVDEVNKKQGQLYRGLSPQERFMLIDEIICRMSKGNKLNLILYDGEFMYVHTNYANSLYFLNKGDCALFSTQPLSLENWQNVTFTTLVVYKWGKQVFTGTNHNNVYIENEENLKYLYQIFSNL